MSATPSRALERRSPDERTAAEQNRPLVRLVPYSPPRLSFDGSLPTLSRSASGADCSFSLSDPASPVKSNKGKDKAQPSSHHGRTHGSFQSDVCRPSTLSDYNVLRVSSSPSESSRSPELELTCQPHLLKPAPFRHRSKLTGLYSDKKFSPHPHSCSTSSATYSSRSAEGSTVPSSSWDPSASDVIVDGRCSSSLTPLHEEFPSQAPTPNSGRSNSASPSSWNHRFVSGLRKGHRRASGARRASANVTKSPLSTPRLLSRIRSVPSTSRPAVTPSRDGGSLQSARSGSTQSERSNYKIYANSSPAPTAAATGSVDGSFSTDLGSVSLSSSHANVVVLGDTSSGQSAGDNQADEGEANVHVDGADMAPCLSLTEFSKESLLVPSLQASQISLAMEPGVNMSRSRRSSHARSLSSVSSMVMEEDFSCFLAEAVPVHRKNSSRQPGNIGSSNARWALFQRPRWNPALSTASSGRKGVSKCRSHTLSSVPGSSGHGNQDPMVAANATGDHPTCPSPVHRRLSNREQHRGTIRLIRDQDEHGDGLADLEALHHHPSHSRMRSLLSNYPSDRNLRSSGSSRSSSVSRSSVPAWARLYYGSGEHRWLATKLSTETMFSDFTGDSRGRSWPSRSPSADLHPAAIQSPRRRPREAASPASRCGTASDGDNTDLTPYPITPFTSRLRTQPSSIWSPHLHRDRRAIGYGIWEPPSAVWSTNSVWFSHQNLQPILFVVGFVFPLAWVIASFLPLPPTSGPEMAQVNPSMSHLDVRLEANIPPVDILDMRLYNHARWWRTLNRAMAFVGIFVIGAIVALIVFGVRQKWRY